MKKTIYILCFALFFLILCTTVSCAEETVEIRGRGIYEERGRHRIDYGDGATPGETFIDKVHVCNIPYSENYKLTVDIAENYKELIQYKGIDHYEKISDEEFIIYTKLQVGYPTGIDGENSYFYYYNLEANGVTYTTECCGWVFDASRDFIYIVGRDTLVCGDSAQYKVYYCATDNEGPIDVTDDVVWNIRTIGEAEISDDGILSTRTMEDNTPYVLVEAYYTPEGKESVSTYCRVTLYDSKENLRDEMVLGAMGKNSTESDLTYFGWNTYFLYGLGPNVAHNTLEIVSSDESVLSAFAGGTGMPTSGHGESGNDTSINVVAKATGKARLTIRCTFEGKEYETYLDYIVTDDLLENIKVYTEGYDTITEGETMTLEPVVEYDGKIDMSNCYWESENPEVASVDNNGTVRGLKAGKTKIRLFIPYPESTNRVIVYTRDITVEAALEKAPEVIPSNDETESNQIIPKTGENGFIAIVIIAGIAIFGIYRLKKYNNMKF